MDQREHAEALSEVLDRDPKAFPTRADGTPAQDGDVAYADGTFGPLPAQADEPPRKLMTVYLPLPAGCFAAILQDVSRHFPDAVLKSQTISIVHVMSAPPAEGEPK